ncbi:hypothetical protein XHC_3753 [Xanthomonas hortorum pv. carotae str. M081]|nr:hypothetical protein XHC_3753 [Xanthomonas hortorum pv. carotae str. M081]
MAVASSMAPLRPVRAAVTNNRSPSCSCTAMEVAGSSASASTASKRRVRMGGRQVMQGATIIAKNGGALPMR